MTHQDEQTHLRRHRELLFGIRRSIRYHRYRRDHYLGLRSWFTFFGLVLGSAGLVLAFQSSDSKAIQSIVPAIIAVISVADLAMGTAQKATLHSDLGSQFARLEKHFLSVGNPSSPNFDADELEAIERERLDIEMDEPATYQAVNRTCHNELLRVEGQLDKIQPLYLYHRMLKNYFRFEYLPSRTGERLA